MRNKEKEGEKENIWDQGQYSREVHPAEGLACHE
jgi:hypothetical protein